MTASLGIHSCLTVAQGRDSTDVPHGVQFIDFEYSCWSWRGFDFGNHFCERAGFEGDYSRFPTRQEAGAFIRAYLSEEATEPPVRAHSCRTSMLLR